MVSVEEELKNYAVKVAEGRATEGDHQRVHQIGLAASRELPVPPAAAPVVDAPTPDPSPKANGRSGMGKGAPLLSKGKPKGKK